jgi:hypothetical protein
LQLFWLFFGFCLRFGGNRADIYYIRVNTNKGEDMIYLLISACVVGLVGAELFQRILEK